MLGSGSHLREVKDADGVAPQFAVHSAKECVAWRDVRRELEAVEAVEPVLLLLLHFGLEGPAQVDGINGGALGDSALELSSCELEGCAESAALKAVSLEASFSKNFLDSRDLLFFGPERGKVSNRFEAKLGGEVCVDPGVHAYFRQSNVRRRTAASLDVGGTG